MVLGACMLTAEASAMNITFDPDGAGTDASSRVVQDLQWGIVPSPYTINQNLGADGVLGNGDVFTENFTMVLNRGTLTNGNGYFGWSGNVYWNVALSGHVVNYSNPNAVTDNLTNGALLAALATSSFGIQFDTLTTDGWMFDTDQDGDPTTGAGLKIADFDMTSGGGSNLALVVGSLIGSVTVNAELSNFTSDYISDELGNALKNGVLLAITTGSNRFEGAVNSNTGDNEIQLTLRDNGFSTTFEEKVPEPDMLALMGMGFLAFGASRRKARAV